MKRSKGEEMKSEMKGVWKCIKPNLVLSSGVGWGGEGGPKIKVAKMAWNTFGFGIFEIEWNI